MLNRLSWLVSIASDILSRVSTCFDTSTIALSPASLQTLLMHVFPRQFSLPSAFVTRTLSSSSFNRSPSPPTIDEAIAELRKERGGSFKTPKGRMKSRELRRLMEQMARNVAQCDFWRVRGIWCPAKVSQKSSNCISP